MARYGREYTGGVGRRGRRRMYEPAYGEEYGRVRGYGAEGPGRRRTRREMRGYGEGQEGYAEQFGYGEDLAYGERAGYSTGAGYGAEPGYGEGMEYGEEPGSEAYDYEFGGRGWPYREAYSRRRYRAGRRGRMFGGEYDVEMRRPEAYGMGYEFEYGEPGAPGYRRGGMGARGRGTMEPGRRMSRGRTMPARLGYEGEFAGRPYGGRMLERGYERTAGMSAADYDIELTSRAGMLSGNTPPDRWPDIGHDADMRPSRERRMSDDEIRETVLENLFQDTWVDPERIDVEVDRGVVTLTGDVRDFMEARYAWDDAWESAGVRGVINNLTVRTDQPQQDMELPQTSGARKSRSGTRG